MTKIQFLFNRSLVVLGAVLLVLPQATWRAGAQAAWNDQVASLISDVRARQIGDILTVIIQENKTASKNTSSKSSKKTGVDAGIDAFLFNPAASGLLTKRGQMPSMKLNASSDFEGGGNVSSTEKITTRLSVRVVDMLPNRQYLVEGAQKTSFSGESQDVVLRGVVREADISSGNTVYSYSLADVTIQFASKGSLTDNTKRGWFTKVWDKVNPF
jgi:flagellar L-ring protein precursor FlgH